MASVLYYGQDERVPSMLKQFFDDRKREASETNSITHVKEDKKFVELIGAMNFETILIEVGAMPTNPVAWITTFKKSYPRITCPLVLIGPESEPAKIMAMVTAGWTDYLPLPPDKPLLIEKISLHSTGKRSSDIRQVYSLKMGAPTDLAKPVIMDEMSEFDCKCRGAFAVPVGDMMILYSKAFSENLQVVNGVLGRCYNSFEDPNNKGVYVNSFYYVGIGSDMLTNIRNALRKQFINSKSKG